MFYQYFHRYLGSVLFESQYTNKTRHQLETASVFPDTVKYTKEYGYTRTWHYLDIPIEFCLENQTIVDNYLFTKLDTGLLKGLFNGVNNSHGFDFILHFLQDMVQPFHTIDYFKGGNDIYGLVNSKNTSLHALWDSILPELYKPRKHDYNFTKTKTKQEIVFEQLYKSFKRACHFKVPNQFVIESSIQYFNDNNLQSIFNEIVEAFIELSFYFFTD